MRVVVAGGHGKVGLRTLRLLADRGHRARGLIRDVGQAVDLEAVGAEAVVCDMEAVDDLSESAAGADAVIFAAGAGPGSGPERKRTVDLGGAVYLEAKAEADRRLEASGSTGRSCARVFSPTTPGPGW